VQVVKEERGNKGAALTTYLSLAGRYSVLMPNTARGGGISRKITQPTDRKRLKKIASELEVPEGMGVILRTAGASRTKAEIKRDFEYLMRLWENVRDLTLQSSAPNLVYEEGSLIKRSIRDLYNKDIDEVLVAGEEGYREAKDFMRMLMPSHAKNVQPYRDPSPLFIRAGVEPQLDAMFSPEVTLKSGGYIVIDQTEALVSIDVNSGKSTREHNIEDTALQTNLEAAEEVARQLRLRDLAGLVVIDFIDMEENKNNRNVERKLKECLKNDRARIQVGRISHFGLLEMSRQRLRTGVLESSTRPCSHCHGTGMIRSVESIALHVLRSLEDNLLRGATHNLIIRTTTEVALYILNQKRYLVADIEARFAVEIEVQVGDMSSGQLYVIERADLVDRDRIPQPVLPTIQPDTIDLEEDDDVQEEPEVEADEAENDESDGDKDRRRRRRRKRRRGGSDNSTREAGDKSESSEDGETSDENNDANSDDENGPRAEGDEEPRRRRRRGRRGGRRGRRGAEENNEDKSGEGSRGSEAETSNAENGAVADAASETSTDDGAAQTASDGETGAGEDAPKDRSRSGRQSRSRRQRAPRAETAAADDEQVTDSTAETAEKAAEPVAEKVSEQATAPAEPVAAEPVEPKPEAVKIPISTPSSNPEAAEPVITSENATEAKKSDGDGDKPKRGGWWQRRSFF
ncbi:MAG: Rne/Rng family ribonuclease, partial [Rhodobacteraceae bacterium]|nr:Rne/Rng family ribonuclease [Paracoccaceae bacterium]